MKGLRVHLAARAARLLAVFLACDGAVALSGERETHLRFSRISLEQGLSQSYVTTILQDGTGFMWFGTEDGLNRYDGYEFDVYKHDPGDTASISHGFVRALYEDRNGTLWVGTQRGLNRWDGNRGFDRFFHVAAEPDSLSDDSVRAICEDGDGILWIGTGRGLNRFDPRNEVFERLFHDPANPASLSHDTVTSLYEDSHGELWIGTNGGGLNRRDRTSGFFVHFERDPDDPSSLGGETVRAILEDATGALWVGTESGVSVLDRKTWTFRHYRHDPSDAGTLSDNRVWALFLDAKGVMWVGTDAGLNAFDPETGAFRRFAHDPADRDSLSNDLVRSIFEDRSEVLWVGTRVGGINKRNVTGSVFSHFNHDPANPGSLSHNIVTSFSEDPHQSVWVGTFGGGLNRFDPLKSEFEPFRHDPEDERTLSSDRIMSLLVDREGSLWVGTFDAGLNRLDPSTGSVERFPHDEEVSRSLSGNGVSALLEDSDGNLWIGTHRGGVNRWIPESRSFVRYRHGADDANSLSSDRVTVFHEDSHGYLWVGTEGGGLNQLDRSSGQVTRYRHRDEGQEGLPGDVVWALHEDRAGTLWVATRGGGLAALVEERDGTRSLSRTYTTREGLPNDFVYGILEDELGNLWLSTNRGLSKFNPSEESFRNYDISHGLQSNEFNFGAYHRTSAGEMFFGGVNGFNAFFPELVPENRYAPHVVLTEFRKLNEPVLLESAPWDTDEIVLDSSDNLVSFAFSALDYTVPEKNTYRYRLENFNDNWIDLDTFRRVTFTNLDPGGYTLRVQGSNNDGIWSEDGLTVHLSVLPPSWNTWWARTLYSIVVGGAFFFLWSGHRRSRDRETAYRKRLEDEVTERTRELQRGYEELERLNQRLEQSSVTDALTGLKNRRFVFENIEQETSAVLRLHDPRNTGVQKKDSLVFIMIDLDNYKEVNDAHGHDVGDQVLIEVREILQSVCRTSDILVRWGGDEFLVVGRVSDPGHSEILAGRIRSLLADHAMRGRSGETLHTTCSIGFACYPFLLRDPERMSWREVLTIADRALYVAKNNGRNAWVGFFGVDGDPSRDLYREILESPEEAVREGRVRLVTSLQVSIPALTPLSTAPRRRG